jgi:aminoglycoside phosphotransferase (APT) family kinase protein
MELDELERRLVPFARAKYADPAARVGEVHKMPGHAGFAYGFTVESRGARESWFLRIPPPNVQWRGTADVLRQVCALSALDGTGVPHCTVKWSGDELEWFGCPYFVVPKLAGDVLRLGPGDWGTKLAPAVLSSAAQQAMRALVGIHRVAWREKCAYLGDPVPFAEDVERWDRFLPKLAEPERFALQRRVCERLLARLPQSAPIGLFHGDFQVANLFFSFAGELLAVIDWELTGVGATLNDVGWVATFNTKAAWDETRGGIVPSAGFPTGDELVATYEEAWGAALPDVGWFRALAAYKFAIITGFNLGLHRRGKRHDPLWEITALSIEPLLAHAAELLG